MIPSYPRNAGPFSSPHVKSASGSNPAPQTFTPFGKYADIGSQKIKCPHPGIRLHVGSASTLFLNKGTLLGREITYISQVWNAWDAESTQTFYEEVLPYIHPEALRPLMGICTPAVINIHSTKAGLSLTMELPHPIGWRPADPYISTELKEKVVAAYQSIHSRGILHNDVKLENVLIGDDDEVTIVDFCKMVVGPEPVDLALEMRAVKFMLDYEGAKEIEYERLRKAESRVGNNVRRSWIRRAAESLGLANETESDELPSQDEAKFPPFSRQCLMRWDSEVVTEGTTHCPGWRGERFEVPEDMQSPPWPETTDTASPDTPQRESAHASDQATTGSRPNPFTALSQWAEGCHYLPSLWSSDLEPAESDRRKSVGTASTPTELSDYAISERSSTTGTDPSERDLPVAPPPHKRLRAEDLARSGGCSGESKRTRRSKSLEPFSRYEGNKTSWATRRTEGLRSSWASPRSKVESGCSIVVLDSDEEDEVWFISREVLQGVKGYLRAKKAAGAAMEMRLGEEERDIRGSRLRVEKALRLSSTRSARRRAATAEESDEEVPKPVRRRSWPYVSKSRLGSSPRDG